MIRTTALFLLMASPASAACHWGFDDCYEGSGPTPTAYSVRGYHPTPPDPPPYVPKDPVVPKLYVTPWGTVPAGDYAFGDYGINDTKQDEQQALALCHNSFDNSACGLPLTFNALVDLEEALEEGGHPLGVSGQGPLPSLKDSVLRGHR